MIPPHHPTTVAVVGGGCSGVLTAVHLLAHSDGRCRVVLIEQDGQVGAGVAYRTDAPWHVLNTPAAVMSAFPGDPDHFTRWARSVQLTATAHSYLPRRIYRLYLQETLARAEETSASPLFRLRARVTAVHPRPTGAIVGLDDGGHVEADHVVLALGNLPPRDPHPALATIGPRYVSDPWAPRALAAIEHDEPVLLIGSGLTAVDVALTLAGRGHRGPIDALSRHGLLPQRHGPWPVQASSEPAVRPTVGLTTKSLVHAVAQAARRAETNGEDWRSVVDGLRPVTQALWRSMPAAERRRFLRRAARVWEVHRHRMAPTVAASIDELRDGGHLVVRSGAIESVVAEPAALRVAVRRSGTVRELRAGHIVNCTGPSTDIAGSSDPLLRTMVAGGTVRADPLGLGFDVTDEGALVGADERASSVLSTLGPLCRGRLWETTAVPEIREQACALATQLVGERRSAAV
ncbi:MAG: FAD/NAD(P)-binding protein [Acidimicrobiia bacterium]|nr:FAD/NAD(P)-binding protein [Acidimicrobiia bacterium]